MVLAKLVFTILAPGALLFWAVDDTLCRKRGLTLYGAGMHYDPLISSRSKALVSWGHDWVVLCLIVVHPFWAPTKVFALPIAARLSINRQGLTKGKKGKGKSSQAQTDPPHRTRPELALELSKLAAQWFPGDEVILPTFTFFATAGCVARTGARPVFVDVDPVTYNLDPHQVESKITPRTRALLVVHLFGQCADMAPLWQVAERHNLPIIEDAAQALGAEYDGKRAGSLGAIGCLSFYPTKNLGAFGDAGAICTSDDAFAERCRKLRVHGSGHTYYHEMIGGMFRLAWCKRYGRPLNEYERIVQSPATAYEPAQPRPYRRRGERAAGGDRGAAEFRDAGALSLFDRDDHRRNNRDARQHVGLQLGLDVGRLAFAPCL